MTPFGAAIWVAPDSFLPARSTPHTKAADRPLAMTSSLDATAPLLYSPVPGGAPLPQPPCQGIGGFSLIPQNA